MLDSLTSVKFFRTRNLQVFMAFGAFEIGELTRAGVRAALHAFASPTSEPMFSQTQIFAPDSPPAHAVFGLSIFVLAITGAIFLGVTVLLVYALVKFRARPGDDSEPPQVFGSIQIELAWTIIPVLIIVVLFLGTARVIFAVEDAEKPASALDVVVVGHQFWWEFRYPKYGIVTANELHVPVADPGGPRMPTYLKLTSADVVHSFWVPRLAGKTDLLPNRVNEMWIEPEHTGEFEGQCAQFCGTQHAKMLLRVYADTPEQFAAWIKQQQSAPAVAAPTSVAPTAIAQTPAEIGRAVFEAQACINCHAIRGTAANGRFGPDLTHLMSRGTIGAGAAVNTPDNLKHWIEDPNIYKPGVLMPAMHLTDEQNQQIVNYLTTLK